MTRPSQYPALMGCVYAALATAVTATTAAALTGLYTAGAMPWWGFAVLAWSVIVGGSRVADWMAR